MKLLWIKRFKKESEVALYQKQIQDFEKEHEEIEIRVNAVREGRMRVAGAIERSQTVKEQLNVQIVGLEQRDGRIRTTDKRTAERKTLLTIRSKQSKERKSSQRLNVIMPKESKKHYQQNVGRFRQRLIKKRKIPQNPFKL